MKRNCLKCTVEFDVPFEYEGFDFICLKCRQEKRDVESLDGSVMSLHAEETGEQRELGRSVQAYKIYNDKIKEEQKCPK